MTPHIHTCFEVYNGLQPRMDQDYFAIHCILQSMCGCEVSLNLLNVFLETESKYCDQQYNSIMFRLIRYYLLSTMQLSK